MAQQDLCFVETGGWSVFTKMKVLFKLLVIWIVWLVVFELDLIVVFDLDFLVVTDLDLFWWLTWSCLSRWQFTCWLFIIILMATSAFDSMLFSFHMCFMSHHLCNIFGPFFFGLPDFFFMDGGYKKMHQFLSTNSPH